MAVQVVKLTISCSALCGALYKVDYVDLRLATLELRRASHPQMPLVLDDVLITSDDERAANILRALQRFSESGQVMLFTHHRHLLDVARSALAGKAYATHSL